MMVCLCGGLENPNVEGRRQTCEEALLGLRLGRDRGSLGFAQGPSPGPWELCRAVSGDDLHDRACAELSRGMILMITEFGLQ